MVKDELLRVVKILAPELQKLSEEFSPTAMLGRYSFAVFFLLLLLGMTYWSDRLAHPVRSEVVVTANAIPPAQAASGPLSSLSKAARAPASVGESASMASENRPLEIEAIGE
jgi:hypothetical protein